MGYQFSSKALKKAELFKKQVLEDRLFGNFTILLCGETNIVSRKGKRVRKDLMKIKDPHKYRALLDKDIIQVKACSLPPLPTMSTLCFSCIA